jgi:glycosyltransferase involved in cell wall biosynthesis
MSMTVSIVVPSFQQAPFLGETLDSLERQVGVDLQILIRDGGSTDGSVEIIRAFAARSRFDVEWQTGPDGGQCAAINDGLRAAKGAVVGYLNSDDVLAPDALREAVTALNEQENLDLVYGEADLWDVSGRVIGAYRTEDWRRARLEEICIISQPACFWRRSLHARAGWFDEGLWGAFDYDFWLRSGKEDNVLHVRRKWAATRQHSDAKTFAQSERLWAETARVQARHCGGRVAIDLARRLASLRAGRHLAGAPGGGASRLRFTLAYWWHFGRLGVATRRMHTWRYWRKWVYPPYAKYHSLALDPQRGAGRAAQR